MPTKVPSLFWLNFQAVVVTKEFESSMDGPTGSSSYVVDLCLLSIIQPQLRGYFEVGSFSLDQVDGVEFTL